MPKIFRLQISAKTSWTVEWYADEETATTAFERACTDLPRDIFLDRIEVPISGARDVDGLALVLNRAQVERSNWPGVNIKKRLGRSETNATLLEDLLS